MFGHLKAEDFINLIEGAENAADVESQTRHRLHLNACAQCTEALASAQNLHAEVMKSAELDQDIPEPDWFQFRAGVRNSMLSRAAKRQAKSNSWSGWFLRPALQPVMSWGLAVAFAAGLSAGLLIWNQHGHPETAPVPLESAGMEAPAISDTQVASLEISDGSMIPDDVSVSPQTSIFEELSQLDDLQSEKLQRLLEADTSQTSGKQ